MNTNSYSEISFEGSSGGDSTENQDTLPLFFEDAFYSMTFAAQYAEPNADIDNDATHYSSRDKLPLGDETPSSAVDMQPTLALIREQERSDQETDTSFIPMSPVASLFRVEQYPSEGSVLSDFDMQSMQDLKREPEPYDQQKKTSFTAMNPVASPWRVEQDSSEEGSTFTSEVLPETSRTAKRRRTGEITRDKTGSHEPDKSTRNQSQPNSPRTLRKSSRLQTASTSSSTPAIDLNERDQALVATTETSQAESAEPTGSPDLKRGTRTLRKSSRLQIASTSSSAPASNLNERDQALAAATETSQAESSQPTRPPDLKRGIIREQLEGGLTKIRCSVPNCTKSTMVTTESFEQFEGRTRRTADDAPHTFLLSERYFPHDYQCRRTLYQRGVNRHEMAAFCLYKSRPHFLVSSTSMKSQEEYRCNSGDCARLSHRGDSCESKLADFVVDSASA